jgi:RNA polymerase sigma factor (TIGR02999 family)
MPLDPPPRSDDVTRLLAAVRDGDAAAGDALLAAVYDELRDLAHGRMRREAAGHTLQATALVHEAWLRLRGAAADFADRRHFFGAAARVMRQVLVDRYRRSRQQKRGGDRQRIEGIEGVEGFDGVEFAAAPESPVDLVALDEALAALEAHDARMAQVVQLRFFVGLGVEETAAVLEVSPRTVKREWAFARAWLFAALSERDR